MRAPKKENISKFSECETFNEGKELYRKLLFEAHPDHGGSDQEVIALRADWDRWVTRRAWEARQQGASFRRTGGFGGVQSGVGQSTGTNPEEFLSDATLEKLREVIESGLNVRVEIVGSFIWIDQASSRDVLTLAAYDFTWSNKYQRWFWADFDHMKKTNTLPRGTFHGSFEDMKIIHRNKVAREKVYLSAPEEDTESANDLQI